MITALIAANADVNARTSNGWTPLHWTAESDQLGVVQLFMTAKANVNEGLRCGCNVLHRVAATGHLEIVKALLAANADINVEQMKGQHCTKQHWQAAWAIFGF